MHNLNSLGIFNTVASSLVMIKVNIHNDTKLIYAIIVY